MGSYLCISSLSYVTRMDSPFRAPSSEAFLSCTCCHRAFRSHAHARPAETVVVLLAKEPYFPSILGIGHKNGSPKHVFSCLIRAYVTLARPRRF